MFSFTEDKSALFESSLRSRIGSYKVFEQRHRNCPIFFFFGDRYSLTDLSLKLHILNARSLQLQNGICTLPIIFFIGGWGIM